MVASRNQQHVMARAFGSTHNGSLTPYGAEGEMATYLNGRRQASMRGLGAGHKPNMQPSTKGEVVETSDISTRFGWGAVFVVKDSMGYYVCEHYCPKAKRVVKDGRYPSLAEAKAACEKVKTQLRDTGMVKGLSGLNGYSAIGADFTFGLNTVSLGSLALLYVGLDFPGARPVAKYVSKTLKEPTEAVRNVFVLLGVGGLLMGGLS